MEPPQHSGQLEQIQAWAGNRGFTIRTALHQYNCNHWYMYVRTPTDRGIYTYVENIYLGILIYMYTTYI